MNSIIEEQFMHSDHLCVVLFTPMGHRCGYVAVTEDSPLYKVDYTSDLKSQNFSKNLSSLK